MVLDTLKEGYARRELLFRMVRSKLSAAHKDLWVGYGWWFLEPLLLTMVYWLLVSVIFQRGGPGYPVMVLCAIVPYRALAQSLAQSVSAVSSQFSLIGQIAFPRIFLPLTVVLVHHVKLFFGFGIVIAFASLYNGSISWKVVFLIIPFGLQVFLLFGISMIMSILGVYVRDLKNLMQFVMRILLYLSPVLYSIDRIPERFQSLYLLNPVASLIVMYRDVIIYQKFIDISMFSILFVESLVLFVSGVFFFSRQEKNIMKYM